MSEQEHGEQEYGSTSIHDLDEDRSDKGENSSRYFFAVVCFLVALICLSVYLNNYLGLFGSSLLLLGLVVFGLVGVLFLLKNSVLNRTLDSWMDSHIEEVTQTSIVEQEEGEDASAEERGEDFDDESLNSFKRLVEEALASIPVEFQQRMENLVVLVENEPGEEVSERVGVKEGHILLGLYEGVPLTQQGRYGARQPEVITIFKSTIEDYCNGDPDRIRKQVQRTVLHEVAHHFGMDHDEMPIWVK